MQWGAWAGAGMASQAPALASHLALRGIGLLLPQEGLSALRKVLQDHRPHPGLIFSSTWRIVRAATRAHTALSTMSDFGVCVGPTTAATFAARLIWDKLLVAGRQRSLFFTEHLRGVATVKAASTIAPAAPKASTALIQVHEQLPRHGAAAVKSNKELQDWAAAATALVDEVVQRLLGRPLRLDEPFMSAGLDSLGAAHLTPVFYT